jgi:hypothetical protein
VYVGSGDGGLYALNPNGTLKWYYQTGDWIDSSPAIGADGTVYVGSGDHNLYALNPNGTLKWLYQTGASVESSPAIGADGTVYVGSENGGLYALNPNGTLKWSFQTGDWIYSSPAISADGMVYVGSENGGLYALNPNGTLKWYYQTGDWIDSSPAIGADGTVYVGSMDGNLYAIPGSTPLANTSWPKFRRDPKLTGAVPPSYSYADGIPDYWRLQYFGFITPTNSSTCATCDADGTGQNNLFKYVAGLDPTNPASVFALNIASVSNQPQAMNLNFCPLALGRTYTPQFSTDLVSGVWLPLSGYAGAVTNGNQVTITDTNPIPPQEFYRIGISFP